MPYKVLSGFTDKDTKKVYKRNSIYPGESVSKERLKELTTKNNSQNKVLIEKVESAGGQEDFPKHTGGGWYELSNGEKVKGKDEAVKAENQLKSGE